MKKLALAPAVAIAITGLAASPVIAAPEAPASADTQPAKSASAEFAKASVAKGTGVAQGALEDVKASVSPQKVSQEDLANREKGVQVTVTGLEAGDKVSDNISYKEGQSDTAEGDTLTYTIYNTTGDPSAIDPHEVNFTVIVERDGEKQEIPASFTVTEGDSDEPEAPETDPKVSLNADKFTESEFAENGVKVTGEGFAPDTAINVVGGNAQSPFATKEVTTDGEGKFSTTLKFEGDGDIPAGDYSVWAFDPEAETRSPARDFTITEDETEEPTAPAEEAKLTVSPESITLADFVKEDKGVTLAVENCEPGEEVRFLVNPKGESSVTAFDKPVQADDEGKASVNVFGEDASQASAYIGDYDVTVTCGDEELTGDFSVEKDANAGGGDDDGNGGNDDGDNGDAGNGGDLPRTGTELTGLVGGAGLLLIGGVAVAMTMRRKKVTQDPAEI